MANALVSLLDLTKRKGTDQAVGLLEATVTYAPEINALMGRPILGTQYKTVRRSLPTVAFRKANDGSDTIKGTYDQDLKECFIIDGQIMADKAVIDATASGSGPESDIEGNTMGLLSDEAQGVLMASFITIGRQLYYGTSKDANGFAGISALTASLNTTVGSASPVVVGAGGTTSSVQSSAFLVWEHIKGAHFIFGGNQGITMLPEWRIQQVNGNNSKPMTAYVNNIQGWIGFAVNHPLSVARIANINLATDNKPLTDKLVAQTLSLMPLQMTQSAISGLNGGNVGTVGSNWGGSLKLFMTPAVGYSLQQSRTQVTGVNAIDAASPYPSLPTSSNGIPIIYTNAIDATEAVLT